MPNDNPQPSTISLELLRDLKHLDVNNLNGRIVPFHALHDGQTWHLWFPGDDRLFHTDKGILGEGCYYAAERAGADDIHFACLEFLQQRTYWPDVAGFVDGIYGDLQNAGASLSKLQLIFEHANPKTHDPARMVVTEIEYVFLTCRSIFDLLQEIMLRLWKKTQLADKSVKKKELPESYRDMLFHKGEQLSADDIASRYGLPKDIAAIYVESAPFFLWLRSYRNLISHSGHTPDRIFATEKGFAISKSERPFCDMDIWTDANSLRNGLGSVLSVVAHLLATTFATCDAFAAALLKVIQFPPPIAPNHRIFVRGPHLKNLVPLDELIKVRPWYDLPK